MLRSTLPVRRMAGARRADVCVNAAEVDFGALYTGEAGGEGVGDHQGMRCAGGCAGGVTWGCGGSWGAVMFGGLVWCGEETIRVGLYLTLAGGGVGVE